MMPEAVRCDNPEPHDFHAHKAEVKVECSGKSRCGAWSHRPHTFIETQKLWCPGICNCGLGRGLHGPGEHK